MSTAINTNYIINQTAAEKIGTAFFLFAALEFVLVLSGAVLTFLVAPASLFVSRTETEAFTWMTIWSLAIVTLAFGLVLLPLAVIAGRASRSGKSWSKKFGVITAIIALLQLPFGTILGFYLL